MVDGINSSAVYIKTLVRYTVGFNPQISPGRNRLCLENSRERWSVGVSE
jgi:hypothetical protein